MKNDKKKDSGQVEFEFAKDFTADVAEDTSSCVPLPIEVGFELFHVDAHAPSKAHDGDAGYDITATWFEKKDFTVIAHTGLKIKLPEGYEAQVRSRSGLASKGVIVCNSPGTIDSGYTGEVMVILGSVTGQAPYVGGVGTKECQCGNTLLKTGDRVAQLVIAPILNTQFKEVEKVDDNDGRGSGGLGSTGN